MNKCIVKSNKKTYMIIYDYNMVVDITDRTSNFIIYIEKYIQLNFKKITENIRFDKLIGNDYYGIKLCIIPSNMCNLKCKYCYSQSGSVNENLFVQFDNIKLIVDKIINNYNLFFKHLKKPIKFLFHGGGEPTYNWKIFTDIVLYIEKLKNNYKLPIFLQLQTNGVLSVDKADWIANHFDLVIISMDGPSEINDKLRPCIDGNSSSRISLQTANIVSNKTMLGIHSVVTYESRNMGKYITNFFISKIPKISFIRYEKYKTTKEGRNNTLCISNEDFIEFIIDSLKIGGKLIKSSIIDTRLIKHYCDSCDGNILYCFPNNMISLCVEHDSESFVIGNYNHKIQIDGEKYKNNKKFISKITTDLKCNKCFAFPFCRGGCRSYYMNCKNYKEQWCALRKEMLKKYFQYKFSKEQNSFILYNQEIQYINLFEGEV